MEKEHTLQQEVNRKRLAESVTNNVVYQEVWEHLSGEINRHFKECHPSDVDRLSAIKMADDILEKIQKFFEQTIITGRMAEFQIEQEKSEAEQNKSEIA